MATRGKYYNRTNICDRCRKEGRTTKLAPHNASRETNKDGNWTGNWICEKCRQADYAIKIGKTYSSRRTGGLNPNSPNAKGDKFQELTCKWRNIDDLNKKNNNYKSSIDHSIDAELGEIDTKGSYYHERSVCRWSFNTKREQKKYYDNIVCYCLSKDVKNIERLYIFPREIINGRSKILIYENPVRIVWYETYRVKDKDILTKVNDIWKQILVHII